MGEVQPLRQAGEGNEQSAEPVFPGVEAALVQAIDDKRSLSLKTMFLQRTPAKEHERVMASLFCVTAVIALREKVIEFKRERVTAETRLMELSADPERSKELESDIQRIQTEAAAHAQAEEQKFRESGRAGQFQMAGAAKSRASGYVTDIQTKRHELATLDADMRRQRDELAKAIKNWGIAIANAESEIQIRREAYGE